MTDRIQQCFDAIRKDNKNALITFTTSGDPDLATSQAILNALPKHGADLVELGMAFSDPVADGPVIQLANERALAGGISLVKTLAMAKDFRQQNPETPLILMGYYNPIFSYGVDKFAADAKAAGVDGLIIVDLPPEEDAELRVPCQNAGIHWIQLLTPTTDETRLKKLLANASGFLYYVAVAGITGGKSADVSELKSRLDFIRQHTDLPIAVGFGIKTAEQVKAINEFADAAVVGSAIVKQIADLSEKKTESAELQDKVLALVKELKA